MLKRAFRLVAGRVWLVAVVALVIGPAAEGTTKMAFVSKRYGYSMQLAGGTTNYLLTRASTNWSGSTPTPGVDPAFDEINNLKAHSLYGVAAKRIPSGWTLSRWMAFTRSITIPPCADKPHTLMKWTLDGAPALVYEVKCADGLVLQLAAVHAHRGYFVVYTADDVERRAFAAGLASFRFLSG
jgi:hypothetical protein